MIALDHGSGLNGKFEFNNVKILNYIRFKNLTVIVSQLSYYNQGKTQTDAWISFRRGTVHRIIICYCHH